MYCFSMDHFTLFTKEENILIIGIPKALYYYRYGTLWTEFFQALGCDVLVSPDTNRALLASGSKLSIDEGCLSLKIYLGHAAWLLPRCDYLFVPRIANFGWVDSGIKKICCPRFEALHDVVRNTFRADQSKILGCEIDYIDVSSLGVHTEERAFLALGKQLGKSRDEIVAAFRHAKQADAARQAEEAWEQQRRLQSNGVKILMAGHGYVLHDPYVGVPAQQILEKMGVTPIFSDQLDRAACLSLGGKLSPTVPWEVNREVFGAVQLCRDRVDGILLMSAFPCGPDSMTNDMMLRRVKDVPILTVLVDNQSGVAGLETRLESFVDILNFRKGRAV